MENKKVWIPTPRFMLRKKALEFVLPKDFFKNKKCLEIGYGAGEIMKIVADRGGVGYGFELSKEAQQFATRRLLSYVNSGKINFIDNFENISAYSPFDVIMAFEVLEHIENDLMALTEWLTMLKDGGHIIISVPSKMSKWGISDVWAGHYRRYEREDLIKLCERSGMTILKFISYGFPLTEITDRLMNLAISKKMKKMDIKNLSKEELSKNSGIDRNDSLLYRILFNDFFMFPFYLLQWPFFYTNFGTGYIMVAKK